VLTLQCLQRRQRLGINAEGHWLVGPGWPPVVGLGFGHEMG
jgi:hypothetical protein